MFGLHVAGQDPSKRHFSFHNRNMAFAWSQHFKMKPEELPWGLFCYSLESPRRHPGPPSALPKRWPCSLLVPLGLPNAVQRVTPDGIQAALFVSKASFFGPSVVIHGCSGGHVPFNSHFCNCLLGPRESLATMSTTQATTKMISKTTTTSR